MEVCSPPVGVVVRPPKGGQPFTTSTLANADGLTHGLPHPVGASCLAGEDAYYNPAAPQVAFVPQQFAAVEAEAEASAVAEETPVSVVCRGPFVGMQA